MAILLFALIPLSTFFINKAIDPRTKALSTQSGLSTSQFGFNTHLTAAPAIGVNTNLTLVAFKKAVDDLVVHNQKWLRFNINSYEVVYTGTTSPNIIWNDVLYPVYDEAVNYAYSKGLKIYLVTNTTDFATKFNTADYLLALKNYHSWLANRYKGKIAVWQVFNETDALHYQNYAQIPFGQELQDPYVTNLITAFDTAKTAIKQVDANVLVTTNFGRYPVNANMFANMKKLLDRVASHLDIITLDLYPDDIYPGLGDEISGVKNLYNKPVLIAETGKASYFNINNQDTFDEKEQGRITAGNINILKAANPMAIIAYQYSDTLPVGTTPDQKVQASFGVVKSDVMSHKASYDPIWGAMVPEIPSRTGLLRVETNPAVGAEITITNLVTKEVVLTKQWGINWEVLPAGDYRIHFGYTSPILGQPSKIPGDIAFSIMANATTTIVANLTKAGITVSPTQTGLLRVETNPAVGTDITVSTLDTKEVALTGQWGIDWKSLPVGNYLLHFNYTGTILGQPSKVPGDKIITIFPNQTTSVVANLTSYGEAISPDPLVVNTATPTPAQTGLLRVETNPPAQATIKVVDLSSNQEVISTTWAVNWQSLSVGQYRLQFSYSYPTINGSAVVIPPTQTINILANKTTQIVADLTKGTAPVSYP